MAQMGRFQDTLRRLAMIDEGFVEDQAGLGLDPGTASALDAKTAALLRLGASMALGSAAVCLGWSAALCRSRTAQPRAIRSSAVEARC